VATDAVGAAVMGFNPAAWGRHEEPFEFSLNHLVLARLRGLGPHRLDEIDIVGAALDEVRTSFKPYRLPEDPDTASYHPGRMVHDGCKTGFPVRSDRVGAAAEWAALAQETETDLPRFERAGCLPGSDADTECGFLVVPEDRSDPQRPAIRLAV